MGSNLSAPKGSNLSAPKKLEWSSTTMPQQTQKPVESWKTRSISSTGIDNTKQKLQRQQTKVPFTESAPELVGRYLLAGVTGVGVLAGSLVATAIQPFASLIYNTLDKGLFTAFKELPKSIYKTFLSIIMSFCSCQTCIK